MNIQETLCTYDDSEILVRAKNILLEQVKSGPVFDTPTKVRDFLVLHTRDLEQEVFGVIWVDASHKLIVIQNMFFGTIDAASVYPREVVKAGLKRNAAACIFFHNHPSGNPSPSQADIRITERLKDALGMVDIRVLDHIVCGDSESVSMAERGLI